MILNIQEFFHTEVLHNSWGQWFWLLGVIIFVIIFKKYISKGISVLLFKTVKKTDAGELIEDFLHLILKPLQYLIVLLTIYYGFKAINYPFNAENEVAKNYILLLLGSVYRFLLILNIAWLISRLGDFFIILLNHRALKTEDPWDDQLVVFLKEVIRILIWILAILSVLGSVFAVNIYSIVAGAGIAGIAIAFAAQESLQNVFGSISIFTEKPFIVGDIVEVDGESGKVIKVGFRSTRIRALDKSFMTIPNKNIVNNKMKNLSRRTSRRIFFNMGLSYTSTPEQISNIIKDIKAFGDNHPKKNDEVNVGLANFGNMAIEIMVEMHFDYEEWAEHIITRNEVLLEIIKIVQNNGTTFAYQLPDLGSARK